MSGITYDTSPKYCIDFLYGVRFHNLEKLNLHAGPMKLRGNVDADFANNNPDFLNGKVYLSNVQILQDAEPIVLDSVRVIAFSDNTKNNIKTKSGTSKKKRWEIKRFIYKIKIERQLMKHIALVKTSGVINM